jgi:hypothetical protein
MGRLFSMPRADWVTIMHMSSCRNLPARKAKVYVAMVLVVKQRKGAMAEKIFSG